MLGFAVKRGDAGVALEFAEEVARKAPLTLAYSKAVLNHPNPHGDVELDAMFRGVWPARTYRRRAGRGRRNACHAFRGGEGAFSKPFTL